jgi:hypothetical protein
MNTEKKTKQQQEKLTSDVDVLQKLIALFRTDPNLPLYSSGSTEKDVESTKGFLMGIVNCINLFSLPALSNAAADTLKEFHKTVYIEKWTIKLTVAAFWEISPSITSALAVVLIEGKELRPAIVLKMMTLLEEILQLRNEFLRSRQVRYIELQLRHFVLTKCTNF